MKILILVLTFVSLGWAGAATPPITAKWLGVAGLAISDGSTTLLFDPVYTKPKLQHWLGLSKFFSDEEKVKKGLERAQISKANGIFTSHCHFDHAVDIGKVSELTGAVIYGSKSLARLVKGTGSTREVHPINHHESFKIGDFTVIPFKRKHAIIFPWIGKTFLPGEVPLNFDGDFYDYKEGDSWGYRLEHPLGSILIDQGSHLFEDYQVLGESTDAYFVGVASKISLDDLILHNMGRIKASMIVPLHFDFFFLQSEWLESFRLPNVELEVIEERLKNNPDYRPKFIIPQVNQTIVVKGQRNS